MSKNWGKKVVVIVLAAMLILTIGGCDKKTAATKKTINILICLGQRDTFRNSLVQKAEETAEAEGAKVTVLCANDSIERQLQQIRDSVDENDVILCNPADPEAVLEIQTVAGDLPIVFFNVCPQDQYLEPDQYIYVGSDEAIAGRYQAQYILKKFPKKKKLRVVLLKGISTYPGTRERTAAVKRVLEKSGKDIEYVFEDYADWDSSKAETLFTQFLKAKQPFDCVISNNDSMALGVIKACQEREIDITRFPIVGIDATLEGCEAIKKGEMDFTVYQSAAAQGKMAIQAAIALARKESIKKMKYLDDSEKHIWIPFEKVDKSNVDQYDR